MLCFSVLVDHKEAFLWTSEEPLSPPRECWLCYQEIRSWGGGFRNLAPTGERWVCELVVVVVIVGSNKVVRLGWYIKVSFFRPPASIQVGQGWGHDIHCGICPMMACLNSIGYVSRDCHSVRGHGE